MAFGGNSVQAFQPQSNQGPTNSWGGGGGSGGMNDHTQQRPSSFPQTPAQQPGQYGGGGGQFGGGQPSYGGQQYPQQQFQQQPSACPCCAQQGGAQPGGCFDIHAPPTPDEQHPCFGALQYCDGAVWMVVTIFVLSLAGFAAVLGSVGPDDLYSVYPDLPERTTSALQQYMHWDVIQNVAQYDAQMAANAATPTPAPPIITARPTCPPCRVNGSLLPTVTPTPSIVPTTTTTSPLSTNASVNATTTTPATARRLLQATRYPLPPVNLTECVGLRTIFGMRGALCRGSMMTAEQFMIHVSRWVNFRGMLYFITFLGALVVLTYARLIYRVKYPQSQVTTISEPIKFDHSEIYAVFMVSWFGLGFFMFFLVCNEMHTYWSVIEYYKSNTQGPLHNFWVEFDNKFVPSVILVTIVLCWPWVWAWAKVGLFFGTIILWYMFRSACVQELGMIPPEKKPVPWNMSVEEWNKLSLILRIDIWFTEFHRFSRYGFGQLTWEMITGKKVGSSQQPNGAVPGGYPGAPGGGAGGYPGPQPPQQQAGMGFSANDNNNTHQVNNNNNNNMTNNNHNNMEPSYPAVVGGAQPAHMGDSQHKEQNAPRDVELQLSSSTSVRKSTVIREDPTRQSVAARAPTPEKERRGSEADLKPSVSVTSLRKEPSAAMSSEDEGAKADKEKTKKHKHRDKDKEKKKKDEGDDDGKKAKKEKHRDKDKEGGEKTKEEKEKEEKEKAERRAKRKAKEEAEKAAAQQGSS